MPGGPMNYRTVAALSASSLSATINYTSPLLPPGFLLPGQNIITAELHQRNASSSATLFDLEMTAAQSFLSPKVVVQPRSLSISEGGSANLSVTVLGALSLRHQ